MGHGEHVPATLVDDLERPVRAAAAEDEIAGRLLDRRPADGHLAAAALGGHVRRRREGDRRGGPVAFRLRARVANHAIRAAWPAAAVGSSPSASSSATAGAAAGSAAATAIPGHGRSTVIARSRGPAPNFSIATIGRRTFVNALVAKASRSRSPSSSLPIAAMMIPWSSDR